MLLQFVRECCSCLNPEDHLGSTVWTGRDIGDSFWHSGVGLTEFRSLCCDTWTELQARWPTSSMKEKQTKEPGGLSCVTSVS